MNETQTTATEPETDETFTIERIPFAEAGICATNDDGKLSAVPSIVTRRIRFKEGDEWPTLEGYSSQFHLKPKRDDFAEEHMFLDFQANEFDVRAAKLTDKAASYRQRAEECRKYGDPETRKKIARRQRLLEQLASIDEQLEVEGFDVDDLDTDE